MATPVTGGLGLVAFGGTQPAASGSLPLSAVGSTGDGMTRGLPFYAYGDVGPAQATLPLFAHGMDDLWESAGLPLYARGAYPAVAAGLPLYAHGWSDPNCPTLWELWGDNWETHADPLWGCQPPGEAWAAATLPLVAAGAETGGLYATLMLVVRRGAGAGLPLVAFGPGVPASGGLALVSAGGGAATTGLTLYASGVGMATGGLALYANGF